MKFWPRTLALLLLVSGLSAAQQQPKPPAGFEISGTVVDALSGQPLAGVHVGVAAVTARNNFRVVITAEDGHFTFDGLTKGKHVLTAQRRGYVTQSFDQHGQYSTSIAVGPGLDARNLVFRLRPQASISGQVLDEHNEPVRHAQVILFQQSALGELGGHTVHSRTITDDEGTYRFGRLLPEKYSIAVEATPWYAQRPETNFGRMRTLDSSAANAGPQGGPLQNREEETRSPLDVAYPVTYYPGVTDPASAGVIALAAGDKATADIILQPLPAIHTRITVDSPDSRRHFSGVVVQRMLGGINADGHSVNEIAPGVIEISGIAPGQYRLDLNSSDEKGNEASLSIFETDLSATAELGTLRSQVRAPVKGTVKLDSGAGLPARSYVGFRNLRTGETFFKEVSAEGEFEIKEGLQPGSYEISASNVPQAFISELTAVGAKAAGQVVEIKGGSPVGLAVVLARGLAQVNGTALRDDKPTAGIMIVLVPEDPLHHPQLFRRDQSDSDGTFTLQSAVPGKYTVLAIADGWDLDYKNPEALKPYLPQGTPVQVEAKGKYEVKVKVQ